MKITKVLIGILIFGAISCSKQQDNEIKQGEIFGQSISLFDVEGKKLTQSSYSFIKKISASEEEEGTTKEIEFTPVLQKENEKDILIKFEIDNQAVEKYNQTYKTSFEILDEKFLTFPKEAKILKGFTKPEDLQKIEVLISEEIKENTPYAFALSLTSADEVQVLQEAKTLFYTIEKVKGQIKRSVKITRQEYFALENAQAIGNSFTLEGLIYVERFRGPGDMGEAGISTFMGVEGQTLLRFGDSGVEPDQLQANGQKIDFKFKTNKWYHIAVSVEPSKTTVYFNGEKVSEFARSGSLVGSDPFFIGKSWSDNRGIDARLSELRIWKTARSGQEIKDNMYSANKSDQNLYAYWKMNEVKNGKIMDASANGINLVLYGQAGKSGVQNIVVVDEPQPIKVK